jgi:hypothetical protein
MSEYVMFIYENEAKWAAATPGWLQQALKEHQMFAQNNAASLRGGNFLQYSAAATSVRKDDSGGRTAVSGPMIEATPVLSGYYVIEAPDLDAATAIAKQIPAQFGGVEIREVREVNPGGQA